MLKAEDREALARWIASRPEYAFVRRFASTDDVLAEAALRLESSPPGAPPAGEGQRRVLIRRVVLSCLVDLSRRFGAEKRGGGASSAVPHTRLVSPGTTPTSRARADDLRAFCLSKLQGRERDVWRRVELEGRSRAEVARELGMSDSAVRGVLFRARKRLVDLLKDDYGEMCDGGGEGS